MQPKKPLAKIIEIKKKGLKSILMPENQANDPKFELGLGDEVTLTVVARITEISNVAHEDLFNFRKVIEALPQYAYLNSVKKFEEIQKEKEAEEAKLNRTKKLIPEK